MLQQKNKKIYLYLICFLFLSTAMNHKFPKILKDNFLLKNIKINIESPYIKSQIELSLNNLMNNNIFFLDKKNIENRLMKFDYLENVFVTKNYPSTLIINANMTELLAITFLDQKKYFVGNNEKFILAKELNNDKELPLIFGKFSIQDFIKIKKILANEGIDQKKINKFYYHKNKRWDIFYKNNIIIKLPDKNVKYAVKLLKQFLKFNEIKTNSIIDLRINNRLILSNE
tara:strand:- start:4534 stop:5220 length:687 start_codon:yes stop_codon:yes gene_type:complete